MAPLELIFRLLVSLLVIVGGILALTWFTKRSPGGPNGVFSVHARLPVAKGVSLAVVRAGSRFFLVGLSEKGVELISELDEGDAVPEDTGKKAPGHPFGATGSAIGSMFTALKNGRGTPGGRAPWETSAAPAATMDVPDGMQMDPAAVQVLTSVATADGPRKGFLARLQRMTLRSYVGRPFHEHSH